MAVEWYAARTPLAVTTRSGVRRAVVEVREATVDVGTSTVEDSANKLHRHRVDGDPTGRHTDVRDEALSASSVWGDGCSALLRAAPPCAPPCATPPTP